MAAHGRRRHVALGEVLVEAGEQTARLFVVVAGRIDVVRPSPNVEEVMATFGPGMFTGEVTMLSGRRGLAQIRAGAVGEVIEVSRDDLLALIQTDGELSEILDRKSTRLNSSHGYISYAVFCLKKKKKKKSHLMN